MSSHSLWSLLLVMVVAALAPIILGLVPGRPPQVLFLIVGGVLIGPHAFLLANPVDVESWPGWDWGFCSCWPDTSWTPGCCGRRPGEGSRLAWAISATIAVGVVGGLAAAGFVHAFVPVSIALTTTALGTLLPILREHGMLAGSFGRFIFAAGAVGELFPIVATSLFLGAYKTWWEALIIASIAALAFLLSSLTRLLAGTRVAAIVGENRHATSQSTLRITVVLLVGLLLVTQKFGVEAALGAFFAGMVLRRTSSGENNKDFEEKLDAVGYGFFIPVFFVSSGMLLDVQSIADNPARLFVFFALLLLVRGAPALLVYRASLTMRERIEMTFLTATTLPLLVALSEIGIASGVMLPQNAAALVGAGVLSIAIFPLIATSLHRRAPAETPTTPNL